MMSSRTLTYSFIAVLSLTSIAFAQDSPQCSALTPRLAYNASSSVTIPALSVSILGDSRDGNVLIRNETSFNWTLNSYIQPRSDAASPDVAENHTETYLWLDVAESSTERLGQTMRACHTFVPLQYSPNSGNVTWSYETLEKSAQDTGDCRTMVSEECLTRLKIQYFNAGTSERVKYTGCGNINRTVPWECASSGMVMPRSLPVPEFNSSLSTHFPRPLLSNSTRELLNETDHLVCDGRNFSSSFGAYVASQDYDLATNFPIMDIMTFFPTIPYGRTLRADANRVQIACLVPGQVTEDSRAKASVQEVLDRYNSTGGNQTAGAALLSGFDVWKLMAWVVSVGFILTI